MALGILPVLVCSVICPFLNSKRGMLYTSLPPLLLSTMKLQREKNELAEKVATQTSHSHPLSP